MTFRSKPVAIVLIAALGLLAAACSSSSKSASNRNSSPATSTPKPPYVRKPNVSVPTAQGKGMQALAIDVGLKSVGYTSAEYFFDGNAVGYKNVGTLGPDGNWRVSETGPAAYKSRLIVVHPKDPSRFNGTVFVEWFNVTGGVDAGAAWISAHNEILRSGAAWVGVTAQADGINGSAQTVQSSAVAIPQGGLRKSDPVRYGTLHHPGDLYSNDIFTQAAVAARGDGNGAKPLASFDVKRLIGIGQSQSAGRLTT
jgi:hypothetical protein